MKINDKSIDDKLVKEFAEFHGWTQSIQQNVVDNDGNTTSEIEEVDNPKSAEDFAETIVLGRITNDITEARNRAAIANVKEVKL